MTGFIFIFWRLQKICRCSSRYGGAWESEHSICNVYVVSEKFPMFSKRLSLPVTFCLTNKKDTRHLFNNYCFISIIQCCLSRVSRPNSPWRYHNSSEFPPRFPHAYTSRQAPTDLLCCKAFLMHVLNESQRIDGLRLRVITFSKTGLAALNKPHGRLSKTELL